jgi:hypothetical protein
VLDNGATITYTGSSSSNADQFSGTFTSTGACMNGDSGSFTATLFPTVTGSYVGSFESPNVVTPASVQMALQTDWNFNVTGSLTPALGASVCFSNLTVGTPLAATYGPSIATGDVIEAIGSDSTGNVVVFIASNTDANENPLPDGGLYVTYVGVAGACNGVSGVDVPFKKVVAHHRLPFFPRAPLPPRHGPVRRFGTEHLFPRARFTGHNTVRPAQERTEIRQPER